MASWISNEVKCPFYVRYEGMNIKCRDAEMSFAELKERKLPRAVVLIYEDSSNSAKRFNEKRRKHCESWNYENCPLYKTFIELRGDRDD